MAHHFDLSRPNERVRSRCSREELTLGDVGEGSVGSDPDRVKGDGKFGNRVDQNQRCTQRRQQPLQTAVANDVGKRLKYLPFTD